MGFAKRKRKKYKGVIVGSVSVIGALIIIAGLYMIGTRYIEGIKETHQIEIQRMTALNSSYEKTVFVPLNTIKNGTKLSRDHFKAVTITSSQNADTFISEIDIDGYARMDLEADIPVLKCMISKEALHNDMRIREFSLFSLPTALKIDDFIDVRIAFPNGEDYIVLSKKRVRNLNKESGTIWLWLTEKELLEMSSAIVDAYLNEDSSLYTTVYVNGNLQEAATSNYPANMDVLTLIKDNPNIIEEAEIALFAEARVGLEDRLSGAYIPDLLNDHEDEDIEDVQDEGEADLQEDHEEEETGEALTSKQEGTNQEDDVAKTTDVTEEGDVSDGGFFD